MRCPRLSDLPPPPPGRAGWPWTEESPPLPEAMESGEPWPAITVVTPSFNQGAFLEETLRSVLLQGYPALEYFVLDGGSTDGSVALLRRYEPWLSAWASEADRGQSHAINKGFARATGDLVTFQNSDDLYLPGALADAARRWREAGEPGVVAGAFHFLDGDVPRPEAVPARLPHEGPLDLAITPPESWRVHQVAVFYSRRALDDVGRAVREDFDFHMDRELLYRVLRHHRAALSPRPWAAFRWHGAGKSVSNVLASDLEHARLHEENRYSDPADERRKRAIAAYRRAKGWVRYARDCGSPPRAALALLRAPLHRPALLLERGYAAQWLRALGLRRARR